jgi:hypothetical protein
VKLAVQVLGAVVKPRKSGVNATGDQWVDRHFHQGHFSSGVYVGHPGKSFAVVFKVLP